MSAEAFDETPAWLVPSCGMAVVDWERSDDPSVEEAVRAVRDEDDYELADDIRGLGEALAAKRMYRAAETCRECAARLLIKSES